MPCCGTRMWSGLIASTFDGMTRTCAGKQARTHVSRQTENSERTHCSFAYSALASFRMGRSGGRAQGNSVSSLRSLGKEIGLALFRGGEQLSELRRASQGREHGIILHSGIGAIVSGDEALALEILFLAAGRCLRRRWIIPPARVLQNFIDC